jgi:hypothetical protein
MSGTPRLDLPFLSPGQAQKEFTHNEALQTLDLMVSATVEEGPRDDPPALPEPGECYIVGAIATGAWSGKAQTVAGYTSGGWRFVEPVEGMSVYVNADGMIATFRQGAWELGIVRGSSLVIGGKQVVGPRLPAIAPATGGSIVDAEARTAIAAMLAALRQHGLIGV